MLDLDELERLATRATPGPWETILTPGWDEFLHTVRGGRGEFLFDMHNVRNGEANAAYIVAACNAVPELIAENRALRERVQMRQELVEQYEKDIARLRQKVRELEAELETYKKPIDFPKLREGVAHVDNSLSDFLEDSIKRAAARP